MKRSNLIAEITRELEETGGSWSNYALVDFIIKEAEMLGMLPPGHRPYFLNHKDEDLNTWEPEDET